MNTQNQPEINEYFDLATQKFYYEAKGHIGSILFRELVKAEYNETVFPVRHLFDNHMKVTKGFLK